MVDGQEFGRLQAKVDAIYEFLVEKKTSDERLEKRVSSLEMTRATFITILTVILFISAMFFEHIAKAASLVGKFL